jgi:hypothetical protein
MALASPAAGARTIVRGDDVEVETVLHRSMDVGLLPPDEIDVPV